MLYSRVRRGELDREITFIKKNVGINSTNEDADAGWVKVSTDPDVLAKVTQKPGREMMIADRVTFVQTTLFHVDYREDINTENRIVYNNKVYAIMSVVEYEGRDMYLEIAAEVRDNEVWP
jgi:SPP1 family predicted phage head-tail adaptor